MTTTKLEPLWKVFTIEFSENLLKGERERVSESSVFEREREESLENIN
jgi:hypothetical protein